MERIECENDCMYLRQVIPGAQRVMTNKEGPFCYIVDLAREDAIERPTSYNGNVILYRLPLPQARL